MGFRRPLVQVQSLGPLYRECFWPPGISFLLYKDLVSWGVVGLSSWSSRSKNDPEQGTAGILSVNDSPSASAVSGSASAAASAPALNVSDGTAPENRRSFLSGTTDLKSFLLYFALFLAAIVYWELYLGILSAESLANVNVWFLLFAVPQALLLSAFCGWWKDRFDRVLFTVLLFALFFFYAAQFIYYRVFGSMISMSMLGVGGDAVENFGWAMMVTIKESIFLLLLFAVPLFLSIAWIFVKMPTANRIRHIYRPAALILTAVLWLLASAVLRLGGTSKTSAYHAYASSLVDTDTAAQKLGVLTTSALEIRSLLFGDTSDAEIAEAVDTVVENDAEVQISAPEVTSELPPVEIGAETGDPAADTQEPVAEEDPVDRSPNIFEEIDFEYLASVSPSDGIKKLCEYFGSQTGTNRNEYTGLLEGYNLICICAESFCTAAISEQATPTLYRMSNEGIVLTNFYNSFKNTTTNGEFAFMTGLWPDVSRKADKGVTTGSFGQSAKNWMPYGLGNVFDELGVKSFMFHNYLGSYYGRSTTHKNLGYVCKFMGAMKFTNKWPSSDLEMMKQSVDDFINEDRFNVYYMTFSGHGPYNRDKNAISKANYSKVPSSINGNKLTTLARCYIANNYELEKAMTYLMDRLEQAGKLDNTLIVLVGDHYPYYLTDAAAKSIFGKLPESTFEKYRSTCIMWCGGLEEPIICDTPCCNVDILPTVLNLLGIDYDSRLISGTDIFSDSLHVAMLYNKNFITDTVKYNASSGKATWLVDTGSMNDEVLHAYVDYVYSILNARYAAALSVNKLDFYKFVWENAGLFDRNTQTDQPVTETGTGQMDSAASASGTEAVPDQAEISECNNLFEERRRR